MFAASGGDRDRLDRVAVMAVGVMYERILDTDCSGDVLIEHTCIDQTI